MIASERARAVQVQGGPRPLDPSRDLAQVADLIAAAFGEDMDEEGHRVLQEMRAMSRVGPLLWLLFRTSYEFRETFGGYAWEEEGRVVGNVTLSRATLSGDRWQISNVAVDEAHRRRGIARRLMHLALADARRQGGTWALLQVRHDNEAALALYRSLGFEVLGGETFMDWRGRLPMPLQALGGQEAGADVVVRPIRPEEWPAELALARAAVPPLMQWERPLQAHRFRRTPVPAWWASVGRWLSGKEERVVGAFQGERLLARLRLWVDHRAGQAALRVLVAAEARGQVEEALLRQGLGWLPEGRRLQVEARFPMELTALRGALEGLGFRHRRTLLHMRRDLSRGVPTAEDV